jgi:hypothetical protein
MTALLRAFEGAVVHPIDIGENAVFVLQHVRVSRLKCWLASL